MPSLNYGERADPCKMTYSRIDFAGRPYAPCDRQQSTSNTARTDAVSMRAMCRGQGDWAHALCKRTEPKECKQQAVAATMLRTCIR